MSLQRFWVDLTLKIKQNRWPFFIFFLFYLFGVIYYRLNEPSADLGQVLLIAFCVHEPTITTDLSGLYQLIFPIFIEVVVFGFLIGALLERYNPIVTSKIIAQHHRNHTVVLGYNHLGERIVEYLQEKHHQYSLIEFDKEKVQDLINDGEPVVVGDYTEKSTLIEAGVEKCNEIFCLTNDFRKALVVISKIREINKDCRVYMRAFKEEYQEFLESEPWNAFTFSTSQWSLENIKNWTKDKTGDALVLGFNHISQLITYHLAHEQNRKVFLIDERVDEDIYQSEGNIQIIKENYNTIKTLSDFCDFSKITQVFICWKSEIHFSDAVLFVMELSREYPDIEVYVRIYDEETIPFFDKYHVKTFSTSSNAFKKLRSKVAENSAIRE
ncbi:MAG: potassium channel family protein [Promethearchaeota archaeon]